MGMEERYDAYIAKDKEGKEYILIIDREQGSLSCALDSDVEDNKGVVYYTGTFEEESIQTIFYFVL